MKGAQGKKRRRDSALKLLQTQLKKGTKPEKVNGKTTSKMVELTEGDKKRIKNEVERLTNPKKKI